MITDPERRLRLGTAARADVETRFAPVTQGAALHAILADVAAAVPHARTEAPREPTGTDDEVTLARRFPGEVTRAAREPAALQDLTSSATGATPPLADGIVLAQAFRAARPGLTRVDVHTITYGLPLDHLLELRLRRDDGSLVGATTIPAALAPDRDWLALEVAPERESEGRTYVLELHARGTASHNALCFGVTTAPTDADRYLLGDGACDGALALRTFAADTVGEARTARRT
jgi:hypothetical protein